MLYGIKTVRWELTRKHRKDIPFVGAAKAGNWRNQLPQASILQIETAWGELMTSLGYSLTSLPTKSPAAGQL